MPSQPGGGQPPPPPGQPPPAPGAPSFPPLQPIRGLSKPPLAPSVSVPSLQYPHAGFTMPPRTPTTTTTLVGKPVVPSNGVPPPASLPLHSSPAALSSHLSNQGRASNASTHQMLAQPRALGVGMANAAARARAQQQAQAQAARQQTGLTHPPPQPPLTHSVSTPPPSSVVGRPQAPRVGGIKRPISAVNHHQQQPGGSLAQVSTAAGTADGAPGPPPQKLQKTSSMRSVQRPHPVVIGHGSPTYIPTDIHAFAKIVGASLTYFVQTPEVVLGRIGKAAESKKAPLPPPHPASSSNSSGGNLPPPPTPNGIPPPPAKSANPSSPVPPPPPAPNSASSTTPSTTGGGDGVPGPPPAKKAKLDHPTPPSSSTDKPPPTPSSANPSLPGPPPTPASAPSVPSPAAAATPTDSSTSKPATAATVTTSDSSAPKPAATTAADSSATTAAAAEESSKQKPKEEEAAAVVDVHLGDCPSIDPIAMRMKFCPISRRFKMTACGRGGLLINGLVYAKGTTETLHSQDVFQIPCDEPGPHHRHVWHFLLPQISTDKDRKTMAQQNADNLLLKPTYTPWSVDERADFLQAFLRFGYHRPIHVKRYGRLDRRTVAEVERYSQQFIIELLKHPEGDVRHFLEKVVSVEGLVELSGVIDESLATWDDLVKHATEWSRHIRNLHFLTEIMVRERMSGRDVLTGFSQALLTGRRPCSWWSFDDDRALLRGTFKHGYLRFEDLRRDPSLRFGANFVNSRNAAAAQSNAQKAKNLVKKTSGGSGGGNKSELVNKSPQKGTLGSSQSNGSGSGSTSASASASTSSGKGSTTASVTITIGSTAPSTSSSSTAPSTSSSASLPSTSSSSAAPSTSSSASLPSMSSSSAVQSTSSGSSVSVSVPVSSSASSSSVSVSVPSARTESASSGLASASANISSNSSSSSSSAVVKSEAKSTSSPMDTSPDSSTATDVRMSDAESSASVVKTEPSDSKASPSSEGKKASSSPSTSNKKEGDAPVVKDGKKEVSDISVAMKDEDAFSDDDDDKPLAALVGLRRSPSIGPNRGKGSSVGDAPDDDENLMDEDDDDTDTDTEDDAMSTSSSSASSSTAVASNGVTLKQKKSKKRSRSGKTRDAKGGAGGSGKHAQPHGHKGGKKHTLTGLEWPSTGALCDRLMRLLDAGCKVIQVSNLTGAPPPRRAALQAAKRQRLMAGEYYAKTGGGKMEPGDRRKNGFIGSRRHPREAAASNSRSNGGASHHHGGGDRGGRHGGGGVGGSDTSSETREERGRAAMRAGGADDGGKRRSKSPRDRRMRMEREDDEVNGGGSRQRRRSTSLSAEPWSKKAKHDFMRVLTMFGLKKTKAGTPDWEYVRTKAPALQSRSDADLSSHHKSLMDRSAELMESDATSADAVAAAAAAAAAAKKTNEAASPPTSAAAASSGPASPAVAASASPVKIKSEESSASPVICGVVKKEASAIESKEKDSTPQKGSGSGSGSGSGGSGSGKGANEAKDAAHSPSTNGQDSSPATATEGKSPPASSSTATTSPGTATTSGITGGTAYSIFCKEHRQRLRDENSALSFGEINGKLGQMWKALDDKDREPYQQRAAAHKKKYRAHMEEATGKKFSTTSHDRSDVTLATARKMKLRIELMDNLRECCLSNPSHVRKYAPSAEYMPKWWKVGEHDVLFTKGVEKHGIGQWDQIFDDRSIKWPWWTPTSDKLSKAEAIKQSKVDFARPQAQECTKRLKRVVNHVMRSAKKAAPVFSTATPTQQQQGTVGAAAGTNASGVGAGVGVNASSAMPNGVVGSSPAMAAASSRLPTPTLIALATQQAKQVAAQSLPLTAAAAASRTAVVGATAAAAAAGGTAAGSAAAVGPRLAPLPPSLANHHQLAAAARAAAARQHQHAMYQRQLFAQAQYHQRQRNAAQMLGRPGPGGVVLPRATPLQQHQFHQQLQQQQQRAMQAVAAAAATKSMVPSAVPAAPPRPQQAQPQPMIRPLPTAAGTGGGTAPANTGGGAPPPPKR